MTDLKVALLVLIIGILGLFSQASRGEGGSIGASYSFVDIDGDDSHGYIWHAAYLFNDVLAIEGRFMTPMGNDKNQEGDVNLDYLYGMYMIFTLPLPTPFNPYMILGHTESKLEMANDKKTRGNTSEGGGMRYYISDNWEINVEYLEPSEDSTQISIGLKLDF